MSANDPRNAMCATHLHRSDLDMQAFVVGPSVADRVSLLDTMPRATCFEFGYEGAGPHQLAELILASTVTRLFARQYMEEVIAALPPPDGSRGHDATIADADVLRWLYWQLGAWARSTVSREGRA